MGFDVATAVELVTLGEGWMAIGEHTRAASLFEMASASRGVPMARKEQYRKLRDRALVEAEQVRCNYCFSSNSKNNQPSS